MRETSKLIVRDLDRDLRLIQIAPGFDPADEPLLSHAGLACEIGGKVEVTMTGMTGISGKTRQYVTSATNVLNEDLLSLLAEELNDPIWKFSRHLRARSKALYADADAAPEVSESETPLEADDTPEP